jgi:hypothetical protein
MLRRAVPFQSYLRTVPEVYFMFEAKTAAFLGGRPPDQTILFI